MYRDQNHAVPRLWCWLVPASVTEVSWINGIKYADSTPGWAATVGCVALSLWLAWRAARHAQATTVYILFVALGTAGTSIVEHVVLGNSMDTITLGLLVVLLVGTWRLAGAGS